MSYTQLTKPDQGDATRKSLADGLIDNDAFFNSVLSSLTNVQIANGSFEIDSDSDSEPDLWTPTLYTGGTFALTGDGLGDTDCQHGQRAIKFTSPGGGGNGGGYVESDEYNECSPNKPVILGWLLKSSAATIRNKVEILWFDKSRTSVSTSTVYTSITNPTSWTFLTGAADPPSTARYFRVRLTGAENTTTVAGSCYFDGVQIIPFPAQKMELSTPGSWKWTCPAGVNYIEATLVGGGGGGGGCNGSGTGGGGGGGGAFLFAQIAVTPGTTYDLVLGAAGTGGTSGTSGVGTDGGDTTLTVGATTYTAAGGDAGTRGSSGGTGGAGGASTNGTVNTDGTAGGNGTGAPNGGIGGYAGPFSTYAPAPATDGYNGPVYGAGGSGGKTSTQSGGNGATGWIQIRW